MWEVFWALHLKTKKTDQNFVVVSCYLAASDSLYGRNHSNFLGHLISEMYFHVTVTNFIYVEILMGELGKCLIL